MLRSTVPNPMIRDQQARMDLTQAPGSRQLQRWLLVLFALVLASVTVGELFWETPRLPFGPADLERAIAEDGLIGLNHRLLAGFDRFEKDLNERSIVATHVAPWIQWAQTAFFHVGDHQVRVGRDDWLFFRPAVEFATGPGFLEREVLERRSKENESWQDPISPDPRPAILAFHRELAERGIDLVFLPVPTKVQIHPSRLSKRVPADVAALRNPSWTPLLEELTESGVRVVDPTQTLLAAAAAAAAGDRPQFLARDTHWTPKAVETTALQLAEALADMPFARPGEAGWSRSDATASYTGDLTGMLGFPASHEPWPDQTVAVHPVSDPGGRPWQPRTDAEVLLLGDSFSNVYSTPDLGWGVGAGLAEQLSWALERPVDRIAINAGGASGARRRLAAEIGSGRDRLAGKRVVVWQVSTRELSAGDWEVVSLSPAGGATFLDSTDQLLPTLPMGDGQVVWESNRTGSWRLFARSLEGGEPRQVSPEEPGKQHCCPHFSPDGTRVAYLSRRVGADQYPKVEEPGELRLLSTQDWTERTVAEARSYGWGNRAVVWRDDDTLVFVDAQGRTAELQIASGITRLLVDEPRVELGWLLDPSLSFATHAAPTFSPYQPGAGAVAERSGLGGCEPYFSSDGRWGYWNAGPGGPIQRIDPRTRAVSPLILRNDPRLPSGWRYLYFAMTSRDDRAMAWGASNGDHDHFAADYEIFVAPTDPETLELVGEARRMTHHPATDRYPDVHLKPLALGYQRIEAPHVARFGAPTAPSRRWQLDGREIGVGPTVEHLFERAGHHRIAAQGDEGDLAEGLVVVEPSRPPMVTQTRLRDASTRLRVEFDEPVQAVDARIETDPSALVEAWRLVDQGRALELEFAREATTGLQIRLHGFTDLAQRPNRLARRWVEIAPPSWPITERELLFAWENGRAPNLVFDSELGADRASTLETSGRTYPNRHHALVLDGGTAATSDRDTAQIARRLDDTLEISLELLFTPAVDSLEDPDNTARRLLALTPRRGHSLLELSQRGRQLELELLTSSERSPRPITLASIEPGKPHHLAISFTAAKLLVILDGQQLELEQQPTGTLGPWRGKKARLVLGTEGEETSWHGTVEALAVWGRAASEEDLEDAWERTRRRLASRSEVQTRTLTATLLSRSPIPTLDEISPYRSGLVAFTWKPASPASPEGAEPITVVHWALLDGQRQPITELSVGDSATLKLELFEEQAQLEPYFLSDRLSGKTRHRWFEVGLNR